jgi:integrase
MNTKSPRRTKQNTKQDETSQWPFIRWIENRQRWMVDARTATGGERKFYVTKDEAEGAAVTARIKRQNEGASAFDDAELARYGWTIQRAIKFAVDHLKRQSASVSVEDAVASLLANKRAAGRDANYCTRLSINLGKLTEAFPGKTIASIGALDLTAFLTKLPLAAGTKNTVRADCATLWSYAVKAKWATENEAKKTELFTEDHGAPEILTPDEAAALMKASKGDVAAFHAIGLFAGLRTDEIERIEWEDIKLAEGHIEVSVSNAKRTRSRRRRLVPIQPNLAAWLKLKTVNKKKGPIRQANFRRREGASRQAAADAFAKQAKKGNKKAAKSAAKLAAWPRNVMRHSFVSYRLAATNNAAQTALESGHRENVLFSNYREVVRADAAKEYFAIMP